MSGLQVLHVVCAAVYVGLAVYVVWRAPRHGRNLAFVALTLCFAWWSVSLLMAHNPDYDAAHAATAYSVGAFAWASFGSFALWFGLAFAGRSELLRSRWVQLALILPPVIVMVQQWRGELAAEYVWQPWGWAYVWALSPWTFLFYVYYAGYVALALVVVLRAGRTALHPYVRRQGNIVVLTAMAPFVLSTLTDVVLPWLDIHSIPNIAPAFLLVWTAGIAVAMLRYGLLEVSPESVAEEILDAMRDGLLLVDSSGRITSSNPAARRMFGRAAEELRGARAVELLENGAGEPLDTADDLRLTIDGKERVVSVSRSDLALRESGGDVLGALYLLRDVTARREYELALQRARHELEERVAERTRELDTANRELQRHSHALSAHNAAIEAIRKAGALPEIAQRVVNALQAGFPGHLVTGCRVVIRGESYASDAFRASDRIEAAPIVANGETCGAIEAHLDAAAGAVDLVPEETRLLESVARALGQTVERLAMQQALARADRLATVGILAAGVAHEINNPLTYVMSNLWEIQTASAPGGTGSSEARFAELRERADEALEGCERVAKIVNDLRNFSRADDTATLVSINEPIDNAISMVRSSVKHRARLVVEHQPGPTPVFADPGRLAQVVLNLLVNAAQAIPEDATGGQIAVRTWQDGNDVVVEVRDNGGGIPDDALPKIFDPFFTTKQKDRGTGLGLAISHDIVSAAGGRMDVASVVGEGTRFTIRLPRATNVLAPPDSTAARLPAAPVPDAGRARILIIDDEPAVGRALQRMLGGYDCVVSTSGAGGKEILERDPRFDLVLCDVMMPDIGGADLYAWIQSELPAVADRVCFVTGGAVSDGAAEILSRLPHRVFRKPFDVDEVRARVGELLRQ